MISNPIRHWNVGVDDIDGLSQKVDLSQAMPLEMVSLYILIAFLIFDQQKISDD